MLAKDPRHGLIARLLALVAFASGAVALTARGAQPSGSAALPAQISDTAGVDTRRGDGDGDRDSLFAAGRGGDR
jgi:hypothetical protein